MAVTAALTLATAGGPARAATPAINFGFNGDNTLLDGTVTDADRWAARAHVTGAQVVRVNVVWAQVAPRTRPKGFRAADPAAAGYDWSSIDRAVRALARSRLQPMLNLNDAPVWAQRGHVPRSALPGTWRPDPAQLAAFATAAAQRYGGAFPDPDGGGDLPRVHLWQVWNEPNLDTYLAPQWIRRRHAWIAESPILYRSLLNAVYPVVKHVSAGNLVIGGGTAPYGDPSPGAHRISPLPFYRAVFCLRGAARLAPTRCPEPAHMDVVAQHIYAFGGPLVHALDGEDVAVPDVYRLTQVVRAAERVRHVLPRGHKRLWVTEISWDSRPPDPHGVPVAMQARWIEQALYVLWRQGVDTVLWLQLIDQPPIPSYAASYQGGVYFRSGRAKPSWQALHFPFVAERRSTGTILMWGRAPSSGELAVEVRRDGAWHRLRRIAVSTREVFSALIPLRGSAVLRASLRGAHSLTWHEP